METSIFKIFQLYTPDARKIKEYNMLVVGVRVLVRVMSQIPLPKVFFRFQIYPRTHFCLKRPRRRIRGIEACHARKFLRKSAKIEEMIHTIIPIWV